MLPLITPVVIPKPGFTLDYQSGIIFMGSCFSDYIGGKLEDLKFRVCHNPFGVVYNPLSVAVQIELLLKKDGFEEQDLNFRNELWFSYMHYTLFSNTDRNRCLRRMNQFFSKAKELLASANILFITLGTSYVFQRKDTGEVVSNCHKIPAREFTHRFANSEESVRELKNAIQKLRKLNPQIQVVFTVSPVRHWKEGAVNNLRSKAALILAVQQLEYDLDNVYYFPAYEIFMDELRDYRFYAQDMLHPSEIGIQYLWNRFCETFITSDTKLIVDKVDNVLSALRHRALHADTNAHRNFLRSLTEKMMHLQLEYPFLDLNREIASLRENV
jgi:hypothetical protein